MGEACSSWRAWELAGALHVMEGGSCLSKGHAKARRAGKHMNLRCAGGVRQWYNLRELLRCVKEGSHVGAGLVHLVSMGNQREDGLAWLKHAGVGVPTLKGAAGGLVRWFRASRR